MGPPIAKHREPLAFEIMLQTLRSLGAGLANADQRFAPFVPETELIGSTFRRKRQIFRSRQQIVLLELVGKQNRRLPTTIQADQGQIAILVTASVKGREIS